MTLSREEVSRDRPPKIPQITAEFRKVPSLAPGGVAIRRQKCAREEARSDTGSRPEGVPNKGPSSQRRKEGRTRRQKEKLSRPRPCLARSPVVRSLARSPARSLPRSWRRPPNRNRRRRRRKKQKKRKRKMSPLPRDFNAARQHLEARRTEGNRR